MTRSRQLLVLQFVAVLSILSAGPAGADFDISKVIGRCFSGGCDVVWGLNQRIDSGIQSKVDSLVGPAKQAFLDVINVLFDQKLTPMINSINDKLASRLDQAGELINNAEKGIDEIIDTAASQIETAGDKITAEIKDRIIDESFNRADALESKVMVDIDKFIERIDCLFEGKMDKVQLWVQSQFTVIPHPWDRCYGYSIVLPASDDYPAHYKIKRCEYLRQLDNSRTIRELKENYWNLSYLAREFSCVTGDPVGKALMDDDARQYSEGFEIWRLATQ
jgi:hypothetical protein